MPLDDDFPPITEADILSSHGPQRNSKLAAWLLTHGFEEFEGGTPAVNIPGFGLLDAKEISDTRLKRRDDLDTRISAQKELVDALIDNELVHAQGELALVMYERYSECGGFDILQQAIALLETVLGFSDEGTTANHARLLVCLGNSLCSRFKERTDIVDIERSQTAYNSALRLVDASTDMGLASLLGLGVAKFWLTFSRTLSDALAASETKSAISILERALTLAPAQPSFKFEAECRLYLTFHLREYWETASSRSDESFSRLSDLGLSTQHCNFVSLAIVWCWNCYNYKLASYLEDALLIAHVLNYAIEGTEHPDKYLCLVVTSLLLQKYQSSHHQFSWLVRPLSILRPITYLCHARSIVYDRIHSAFCSHLDLGYSMTGQLTYLDEAISLLSDRHLRGSLPRPLLNLLAANLSERYSVLGNIVDLHKATDIFEQCASTGTQALRKSTYIWNLAAHYMRRFEISSGEVCLINEAIALFEACLQVEVAAGKWKYLYHGAVRGLTTALCQRFTLQSDVSDLERAISVAQDGLMHRSESFDTVKLVSPALALAKRYLGIVRLDMTLLKSAVSHHVYWTAMLPLEHEQYAAMLGEQAVTRAYMWRMSRKDLHFYACTATFRQLMQNSYSRPSERLAFSARWIDVCTEFGNARLINEAYDEVLKLLLRAMPLDWNAQGRLNFIKDFPEVASRAALHSLAQQEVTRAVEQLEGGRALLWSRSLCLRQDFSSIPEKTREQLCSLAQCLQQSFEDENALLRRRQQSDEFDSLVDTIRRFPKMKSFMRAASYSQLCEAICSGPLLILLGDATESFAIIMPPTTSVPFVLPLPSANKSILAKLASNVNDASVSARNQLGREGERGRKMISSRQAQNQPMEGILEQLWNAVMQPIVQSLEIKARETRTRLWILPVGLFAFLPLHAAGIYSGTRKECLSDYCITSYTPSIQVLLKARHNAPPPSARKAKIMMIAEPIAPTLPPLLNTVQEVESIASLLSCVTQVTAKIGGTKVEDVTERMVDASVVHLACHGQQNKSEPLQSGFMLGEGKLTISKLMSLQMPNASIALLSACESAMGDKDFPDEAIHLAAAMLFIGFRSVIGTMWSMHDVDGPQVMRRIYEELLKAGDEATYDVIPRALEAAVRELREGGVPASRWATYIHMGI